MSRYRSPRLVGIFLIMLEGEVRLCVELHELWYVCGLS